MYQSPRMRRLRNDLAALERLQSESTVFRFKAQGNPPQQYLILLKGKSLWRVRGKVHAHESHRVEIKLGASYPRTMPEIRWVTPIYHPNISEIGMVCLGGYGTHWVPSIQLDELCNMLWDMVRYHNYDIRSPYNRDAALWVASQTTFHFPDRFTAAARPASGDGANRLCVGFATRRQTGRVRAIVQTALRVGAGERRRRSLARRPGFVSFMRSLQAASSRRAAASPASSSARRAMPLVRAARASSIERNEPAPRRSRFRPPIIRTMKTIIVLESDTPIEAPGESSLAQGRRYHLHRMSRGEDS